MTVNKAVLIGLAIWGCFCLGTPAACDTADYYLLTDYGSSADMVSIGHIKGFTRSSSALFENPASLYYVNFLSASLFSSTLFSDMPYMNLSVAYKTGFGTFGLGYMLAQSTGLSHTGVNDNGIFYEISSFNYKNHLLKAAYQYPYSDLLSVGFSATYYMNSIHTYNGTGLGVDLGLVLHKDFLTTSFVAHNFLSSPVSYTNSADSSYSGVEKLSTRYSLGLETQYRNLLIYGETTYAFSQLLFSIGLSWDVVQYLTLSIGNYPSILPNEVKRSTTFGAQLNLYDFSISYAYQTSQHLEKDSIHYLTFHLNLFSTESTQLLSTPSTKPDEPLTQPVIYDEYDTYIYSDEDAFDGDIELLE